MSNYLTSQLETESSYAKSRRESQKRHDQSHHSRSLKRLGAVAAIALAVPAYNIADKIVDKAVDHSDQVTRSYAPLAESIEQNKAESALNKAASRND